MSGGTRTHGQADETPAPQATAPLWPAIRMKEVPHDAAAHLHLGEILHAREAQNFPPRRFSNSDREPAVAPLSRASPSATLAQRTSALCVRESVVCVRECVRERVRASFCARFQFRAWEACARYAGRVVLRAASRAPTCVLCVRARCSCVRVRPRPCSRVCALYVCTCLAKAWCWCFCEPAVLARVCCTQRTRSTV